MKRSWWDLLDNSKTGRIDASKIWLHIGNCFASYKFLQIPADKMTSDMLATYLAIITMGHAGMYWLKNRGANDDTTEMGVDEQNIGSDNSTDGCQQPSDPKLCNEAMRRKNCSEGQQATNNGN